MIPKLCSDDILFWETMYVGGEPQRKAYRGKLGLGYWEKIGTVVKIPKKQLLFRYDEVPDRCYIVKQGLVIAYEELPNGNELIYYMMDKNAMFLEANMMLARPADVNFRTAEDCELICITKDQLMKALDDDPKLMSSLFFSVANKFLEAMEELREDRGHSAEWRLCNLLSEFSELYGIQYDGKILIQKNISLQLLAGMLGVNRATTVRAMHNLRDLGLVEHINGFYCIRSIEALKRHQRLLDS